jgi:hypothetical protein
VDSKDKILSENICDRLVNHDRVSKAHFEESALEKDRIRRGQMTNEVAAIKQSEGF